MSDFVLHMDQEQGETPVPNLFLDEYMPSANGEYVKIYLYLLRCMTSGAHNLSVPAIADRFDHTEKDVLRSLIYWEKAGLLRLEYSPDQTLTGICLLKPEKGTSSRPGKAISCAAVSAPASTSTPQKTQVLSGSQDEFFDTPAKTEYTADQMDSFQEQAEIRQLLFISEQYLGKTLTPMEISTILYFYDGLGFSVDLIEYLIEYCACKGRKSLRYIEAVALAWHKEGYKTVAEAKNQCNARSKLYFSVLKSFGISGRNPVDAEMNYIDKWTQTWGFSVELVTEACNRTMASIHQPNFEYADSILKNWRSKQVTTLKDIAILDTQRSKGTTQPQPAADQPLRKPAAANNRFHNFKQRDYDFNQLEKQLSSL